MDYDKETTLMPFDTKPLKPALALLTLAAALAACSPEPADAPTDEASETSAPMSEAPSEAASTAVPSESVVSPDTLTLEGLGDLKIGQPLPADWKMDGVQASDECLIASSKRYPEVYAIVEGGKVRRVSAFGDAKVKLVEGIGVGATEAEVKKWFAGFRSEPHAYVEAPAKYLTAPNATSGDPALRFEMGANGKVETIHIGTMPVLGYVEGCA